MNNINFFITLKHQLIDQINTYNKVNEIYSSMDRESLSNIDEYNILNKYLELVNVNSLQIESIKKLLNDTNEYIQRTCHHDMQDDYIDINPETTMYISYCKICEFNN